MEQIMDINDYILVYTLPLKIKYNEKIYRKSLMIYNDKYDDEYEGVKYVMMKKKFKIDEGKYGIYMKGKDYDIYSRLLE